MNSIIDINDILYQISHFLSLREKLIFRLVSKNCSKQGKNIVFLHIGEIISNKIGLDNNKEYADILREIPLEMIKEIVGCLEIPFFEKKLHVNRLPRLSIGLLLKISRTSKEDCIKRLKTKLIFRDYEVSTKYIINSRIFRKYYPNCYALLLQ